MTHLNISHIFNNNFIKKGKKIKIKITPKNIYLINWSFIEKNNNRRQQLFEPLLFVVHA
jgi:hypothetical protein